MVYIFLAEGFEETEALAPADCLRRCGIEAITVGVGGKIIKSSHGFEIAADITESEVVLSEKLEMIILPGGMPGTLNLEKSQTVQKAIDYCAENGIYIGAICAAPSILGHKGLLKNHRAVCFKGFESHLEGAETGTEPVCVSGKFITSRGMGTAVEFGLKLVEVLISEERSLELRESIMCPQ